MLRSLGLKPVYDSSEHDLVADLIIPLLRCSKDYMRGVGFFSSGWLQLAAKGLMPFVENNGLARVIMSPILSENDWTAFQLGEKAKTDKALKEALSSNIADLEKSLEKDTLNTLAWMIADGVLEFRFALPRKKWVGGDYHDKVALFTDGTGDEVALHGSFNDSIKGSLNGEAFSVFASWKDGQQAYVVRHRNRLVELWNGKNEQFQVFTIPEAIREKFINLRTSEGRPYSLNSSKRSSSPVNSVIRLHPFQKEAIQAWLKADCRGLLEMATGTGKTFTALSAAKNRLEARGRLALIILVPYLHLLEQWAKNCTEFGFSPILCSGSHAKWQLTVKSKIQDFNIGAIPTVCILAVHSTASSDRFANAIRRLPKELTLLIADEAHGLGAPKLRQALLENTGMRLGLSATPRRWFDEEGTQALLSYFGGVCFEFSLEEAIGKYLTKYEYLPQLVNLSSSETSEYEALTSKITTLLPRADDEPGLREQIKTLLIRRAMVISSASEKLDRLLGQLNSLMEDAREQNKELSHVLVYCAPGQHRTVLRAVSALGLRCHEFVHTVSLADRGKVLDQFGRGDIQILIAVKCLDEGVDVPSTRIAFFLASTTNPKEFVQRRGRVLRLSPGKDKAILYDFIVVPRQEDVPLYRDIDAGLLKREMPRFAEFSSLATNHFVARAIIRDILDKYQMLDLLDEKPWDIYRRLAGQADDGILTNEHLLKE